MTSALPCLVCGVVLPNVDPESVNQPSGGTYLQSHGSYGSTVWDPFDGSFLEFSICDDCLVKAGDTGRALRGRDRRPVVVRPDPDKPHRETHAGAERVTYPLEPWTKDTPHYPDDDVLFVTEAELGADLRDDLGYPVVDWAPWAYAEGQRRAKNVLPYFDAKLIDLIDMPDFNPASQNKRGDWGLRCVSDGSVVRDDTGRPRCVDHGAMNVVNEDRSLWRCLACGRGCYADFGADHK